MNNRLIRLQPKQAQLLDLVEHSQSSWIGDFGGRGGAKSAAIDRIMLTRRIALPGTVGTIVMRNYDQVKRYHIDMMIRDFPDLEDYYKSSDRAIRIPVQNGRASEIHFNYAEDLSDVIRRFRSANYYDVFVDQAEQFTETELREMKQCVRWPQTKQGACKFLLAFNMGGASIDFLRKKFHLKEYNKEERENDFAGIHVFPWDNVEWVRMSLAEDGLTEDDYYNKFTEEQRMEYCAARSDYGRNLVSQDEALMKRDWLGSWESLEGAFFGRVFDRDSCVITQDKVAQLLKPWSTRWLSQDWGKGHYCPTLWNAMLNISPDEAKRVLGWDVKKSIKAVLTYREYIAGGAAVADEGGNREIAEQDIAREIINRTPKEERPFVKYFYLSPDAFELSVRRQGQNQIAQILGGILKEGGLPYPTKADNERVGGWSLMYNLLLETKRHGAMGEDCWLISANCPQTEQAIPLLMRNPDNLDDVLKTDEHSAKIEIDVSDSARYSLKSSLSPGAKPKEVAREEAIAMATTNSQKHIADLKFQARWKQSHAPIRIVRRRRA